MSPLPGVECVKESLKTLPFLRPMVVSAYISVTACAATCSFLKYQFTVAVVAVVIIIIIILLLLHYYYYHYTAVKLLKSRWWNSTFPPLPFPSFPSPPFPFPLSSPLEAGHLNPARDMGERCKLLHWGLGRSPSRNRIWCI